MDAKNRIELFFIKAKNAVIAAAMTSIFNEYRGKKKRFIGLPFSPLGHPKVRKASTV